MQAPLQSWLAEQPAYQRINRRRKLAVSVTRKRKDGRTEWIPPPHLDTGQTRVNDYHHPQNYLLPEDDDEP